MMMRKREAMASATFYLPVEMTIDILSRLPVKSLLRFKSVCKTWYALIETPNFISKRLQIQSTLNSSLLVNTWNWGTQKHTMFLLFNDGFKNSPVNLDFPFLDRSKYFSIERRTSFYDINIAGICDGLVCIFLSRFGYPLIICNPLTRKFRFIPHFKWNQSNGVHHGYISVRRVSFGFGFHPSANGYKLIRIVFYFRPIKGGIRSCKANLYVVSTNTWTEIDDKKLSLFTRKGNRYDCERISESSASVVLNGVFYWQAQEVGTNRVILVSFDMGDEVFRKIRTPPCLDEIRTSCLGENSHGLRFMELKDKVALVFYADDKYLDVWVLNKDQSSWTNQFKIESFPRIASNVGSGENGEIRVVGFAKNDELLVTDHKASGDLKLFLFDPNTQETKDLYFCQVPHPCSIYLYAKTLLPVMQCVEVMLNRKNNKSKH